MGDDGVASEQQVEAYRRDGFVVVENVLDAQEVAALRRVTDELVEASRGVGVHTEVYDLEPTHSAAEPRVRRIKQPHLQHPAYAAVVRHPRILAALQRLMHPGVRFDISKLNLKSAGYGAAVEWHQDWAFYPHTNDDLAAVGVMMDDMRLENGPLLCIPGSHRGPVHDHHDGDGFFGKTLRSSASGPAYSYYELLWNFLTGATPSTVIGPRPPDAPNPPAAETICDARASTSPALPSVVTVSSASYGLNGAVAPDSIVATFGANLTANTATATTNPWPTTLGGLQVSVTDARGTARLAPLFYVSPTQLLYLIPTGTAPGTATIAIGNQRSAVTVAATAPAIYTARQNGKGVAAATYLRVTRAGARSEGLIFDPATNPPVPIPVSAGDQVYLILYGTGMRGGSATATVGDVTVPVAGPVAQGQYQGLDQINLGPLPLRIGAGTKEIIIRQGDSLANATQVAFRQQ